MARIGVANVCAARSARKACAERVAGSMRINPGRKQAAGPAEGTTRMCSRKCPVVGNTVQNPTTVRGKWQNGANRVCNQCIAMNRSGKVR